jgi:Flp pilus assembly protein TadD
MVITQMADAHHSLGLALARQKRLDDAIPHLSEALRLRPGSAQAHNDLANMLGDR